MPHVTSIGLDVHARSVAAAAFNPFTGEVVRRSFGTDASEIAEWALGFEDPRACYESGPTGFHMARELRAGVREEARGALLHGVLARDAPEARPRRREARPGGRAHRQGPPARHRRARVPPARRGRGEAALPGLRRRIRETVGGDHHESGVQQVGVGVRGRPDGRRRDRPHRPPREARPVPRRVLPRPPCPHAGGLAAQKACALPMLRLLNFRCSFCSNPLDETHRSAPAFASWCGLTPSEHSSGESERRGGITKAGNALARTALIESAWHYSTCSPRPKAPAPGTDVPPAIRSRADDCTARLHRRREALAAAGKGACKANAAVARELACWVWEIGCRSEGTVL